ncbi:MAG TPA: tyrosine-type recombinase/integrase [Steroidobacteraceae bacterium]|nr:tyrosine-type recombinase/integrase [Steroidobacteraceae bacterium]
MSNTPPLQRFDAAVEAFISSRRALGRAIRLDEYVLRRLRSYLARAKYPDLDAASFARWRRLLRHCAHNTQIDWAMMVYRFCRYRRRRECRCFLPQRWTLGRHRPYPLPTPIYADQVRRLLDFVASSPAIAGRPLAHFAHRLAIVLLYTAGLRRGEAARLRMEDVDGETGVVRVCASKFHKSRWVPLSSSATRELRAYLRARAAIIPREAHNSMLLCSRASRGYSMEGLSSAVRGAMSRSGIWANATPVPRVHDFRHAFAVAALRRWYEEGRDVQSELPKLAMYMGHVSIASTTYYLRFMPAVVNLASERFASECGTLIEGEFS